MRSRDPYRAELRSLMVDSALGGAWIALMKFNLLPSVLLLAMLSMDKLIVGGTRFLGRCSLALLGACGVAVAASALAGGFEPRLYTSMWQIAGSLPLLVVYPLAVGLATYHLARRVRDQNRMLAQMSRTDGLSRLLNRQHWEVEVAAEFQRSRHGGHPASLLMLDMDGFKAINDSHGHPAGDEVIRTVSALLSNSLRAHDIVGRYGGEEFGVALPETAGARAQAIAERLRKQIESTVLERTRGIRGTISIGITELQPQDATHAEWIARADQALYAAKQQGRNRSVRFPPAV
jgi:diguanylate cyclase